MHVGPGDGLGGLIGLGNGIAQAVAHSGHAQHTAAGVDNLALVVDLGTGVEDGGLTYYMGDKGIPVTGWMDLGPHRYYFQENG